MEEAELKIIFSDRPAHLGPDKDCDGPCRELAKTRIENTIKRLRDRLAGLMALLKVAERAEPGSPLEEELWRLSCGRNFEEC